MSKTLAIQDKLARSLDAANTREAKARPQVPQKRQLAQHALAKAAPAKGGGCARLSISLFSADLERVKQIRAYVLAERGELVTTSQAIKGALRTAPLSKALCDALDAAAAEDGRKVIK